MRRLLARAVFSVSRILSAAHADADGSPYRVLGGPLAGVILRCPTGERPTMVLGSYEPHVVNAFKRVLRPGDSVIDVGAHVGYLSLVAAHAVGAAGSVVAIEANPRNARLLRWNLSRNGGKATSALELALSDVEGTVTFASFETYSSVGHIFGDETPADATLTTVTATTIDDLVFSRGTPPPRLIKIDVEGAELRVLHGARRLLREYAPSLIVEVRRDVTMDAVHSFMQSQNYVGTELKSSGGLADEGVIDVQYDKRASAL